MYVLWSCLFYVCGVYTASANSDTLTLAKERWMDGDPRGVISIVEPWLDTNTKPYGKERDTLRLLLANAYAAEDEWNLAVSQYSIVRSNNRALSKHARLEEPWAAFNARLFRTAIKRCKGIRQKYPESNEAIDCLMLIGMSNGELGHIRSSGRYFREYLNAIPESPFRESMSLMQAEYTYRKDKKAGYKLLYNLYFNHRYPTTDVKIQEILGKPIPITTLKERSGRINSFIKGNRLQEAWALYTEIRDKETHTPNETAWLRNNLRRISWKTRQFDAYLELATKTYAKKPTSENAYKIFRAYCKAGQWTNAANFGQESLDHFGSVGRWAGTSDEVARAQMFAGQYTRASELWSKQKGNDAKFYTAFSLYMADDYQGAIEALTPLTKRKNAWDAASHYWIGRSLEAIGQDPVEHYTKAAKLDSSHWYDILVRQRQATEVEDTSDNLGKSSPSVQHKGMWTDARSVHVSTHPVSTQMVSSQVSNDLYSTTPVSQHFSWNTFTTPEPQTVVASTNIWPTRYHYPDPYAHTVLGTQEELKTKFKRFVNSYSHIFPNLSETYWLVQAGLYPEAARNMQANYQQWEQGRKQELSDAVNKQMLNTTIRQSTWRALFLYTRTHHYVLRYTSGMRKYYTEEEDLRALGQINHPLVRPAEMWSLTEQYNVDPWLMLGLMRQESAYQETVRSWVGAIGYIQVMPATGAKLAFLLGDAGYSPKDLENPETNLRYGIFYFSKLMERFDNAYPLAVGSYNGGPHNMSRWYRDRMGTWEMDEFVEHIAYDETRRYVKKVTGHYAQYIELYFDDTHAVYIPKPPLKDDPTVIDF